MPELDRNCQAGCLPYLTRKSASLGEPELALGVKNRSHHRSFCFGISISIRQAFETNSNMKNGHFGSQRSLIPNLDNDVPNY